MTHHQEHRTHAEEHPHVHGPACGHEPVRHDGHTDYAHDGHLHHHHDEHVDDHVLADSDATPVACTPGHACETHAGEHEHHDACEHPAVPHADHVDYVVDGHLHHPHAGHCDDHGSVRAA